MVKGVISDIDRGQCPQGQQGNAQWLWNRPLGATRGCLILAHGAGAPMDSPFLKPWLKALRRVGLRYCASSSPIWHCGDLVGASAPNPQAQLLEQWRQVYQLVRQTVAGPVAIAGKSMGGRMASMLADEVGRMD